jgi:hypothetical protein
VIVDLQHWMDASSIVISSIINTYSHTNSFVTASEADLSPKQQDGNLSHLITVFISKLCLQLLILQIHTILPIYEQLRSSVPNSAYPNHFFYDLSVMLWIFTSIATEVKPDYEQICYHELNSLENLWLIKQQIKVQEGCESFNLEDIVILHHFPEMKNLYSRLSHRMTISSLSYQALPLAIFSINDSYARLIAQYLDIASHYMPANLSKDDLIGYLSIGFGRLHEKLTKASKQGSRHFVLMTHLVMRAYIQLLSYHRKYTLQSPSLAVMVPLAIGLVDDSDPAAQLLGAEALYTMMRYSSSSTLISMLSWLIPKIYHLVEVIPSEHDAYRIVCRILISLLTLSTDTTIVLTVS